MKTTSIYMHYRYILSVGRVLFINFESIRVEFQIFWVVSSLKYEYSTNAECEKNSIIRQMPSIRKKGRVLGVAGVF